MVFAYVQMALDVNYIHGKYLAVKLFIKNGGNSPHIFWRKNVTHSQRSSIRKSKSKKDQS